MRAPRPAAFALLAVLAAAGASGGAPEAAAPFRWEGFVRRNPGIVLFRSRWNPGVLELRDDLLRWTDRADPGKNLVLPVQRITGHVLKCGRGEGETCTEWRVSTKTETYVFREAPPAGGTELRRAFDALRGAYADLPSSEER